MQIETTTRSRSLLSCLLSAAVFLLAIALGTAARADGVVRFDLGGAWQVARQGTSETIPAAVIPATVPGCIHTDLLAAKKIPDPFYRDNEKAVQWVGEANWLYSRSFDVAEDLLAHDHVVLKCEGLDTLRRSGSTARKSRRPTICFAPTSST